MEEESTRYKYKRRHVSDLLFHAILDSKSAQESNQYIRAKELVQAGLVVYMIEDGEMCQRAKKRDREKPRVKLANTRQHAPVT